MLLAGLAAGMTRGELGIEREHLGDGIRLGDDVFVAHAEPCCSIAALVPVTSGYFEDERVDVSFWNMVVRVLIVIPLGTVLVEEVNFRGVLHGLLRRRYEIVPAALMGATLFGVWHLFPVWNSYADVEPTDLDRWETSSVPSPPRSCRPRLHLAPPPLTPPRRPDPGPHRHELDPSPSPGSSADPAPAPGSVSGRGRNRRAEAHTSLSVDRHERRGRFSGRRGARPQRSQEDAAVGGERARQVPRPLGLGVCWSRTPAERCNGLTARWPT